VQASRPAGSQYAKYWALSPGTTQLNHGSFGACARVVLEEQSRLRADLESDPPGFFLEAYPDLLHAAIRSLSDFLNADPTGLVFVHNSTSGINAVLRSHIWTAGDELIVTDHSYQACRNAFDYVAERHGTKTVPVAIPFENLTEDEIVDRFLSAVTERTRLALVDTVTSPTALRMPFERLTAELQARDVDVLVDASHGPGLVPLDLRALDAAYVTGNCHKWLCTPKGSGFVYVRSDRRESVRPLAISHGYSALLDPPARFRAEFDWQGTLDPTPWLCVPFAIRYIRELVPGGWPVVIDRNHELALLARRLIADAVGSEPVLPECALAAMVTFALPVREQPGTPNSMESYKSDPLMVALYEQFRIRVFVMPWPHHGARYLRVSAALYNSEQQFEYLAHALKQLAPQYLQ